MNRDANTLILFDCDGTLVDGQHLIFDAMQHMFRKHGLRDITRAEVRQIIGLSLPDAMQMLIPEQPEAHYHDLAESYKASFTEVNAADAGKAEPLYEGTVEMLRELDAAGYVLGVATGKSMRGLRRVLEHHGLLELFVTLQTSDTHPSKPHPSMAQLAIAEAGALPGTTFMIGDTSYDMVMGRAAGCHTVGVSWGYHEPAILEQSGAHHLIDSWTDLAPLAGRLLMEAR